MRPINFLVFFDKSKDGNCLNSLSEPHIISENTTNTAFVQANHPIEPNKLIIFQMPSAKNWWLLSESGKDVFVLLFFLNHLLDFLIFLLKMSSFFDINLSLLSQYLMLREKKVCIILSLFYQALDGFFSSSIIRGS